MKLEVPFVENTSRGTDCGPVALDMVLRYFGVEKELDEIRAECLPEDDGVTWTAGLARAAAKFGFEAGFFSLVLGINEEHFEEAYYQEHTAGADAAKVKMEQLVKDCRELGVSLSEKDFELEELLSLLAEDSLVIVLLDWNKITGKEGYQGHIVPIVGYDERNVFVHDSGPGDARAFYAIPRDVFEKARTAKGTDEDVVVVKKVKV
ncbi:hypothetical protein CMI48_01415 [Candidatus Pacearchaeota archaeon]|nr:hypothetical protein [Candidatus Pacearchaeota archaeon]